jgi:hypothetical protein
MVQGSERTIFIAALAVLLSGCRGSFEIPPQPVVVDPAPNVAAQVEALCSVRAARFHGLVTLPCIDVAREIRP